MSPPGWLKWLNAKRGQNVLIALFLIVAVGNLIATHDQTEAGIVSQRAEQARYERGQRLDQERAKQAAVKGAIPECMALLQLSLIRGSHGTSDATYGIHLEAGFRNVYARSGCPKILTAAGK